MFAGTETCCLIGLSSVSDRVTSQYSVSTYLLILCSLMCTQPFFKLHIYCHLYGFEASNVGELPYPT